MEDFVARNSRWRLVLLMFLGIGCVVLGMWMVGMFGEAPVSRRHPEDYGIVVGWACLILFGFATLAIIARMFDDRPQLWIGPSGIKYWPRSREIIPWSEIADVSVWSHKRQKAIVIHLRNPDLFPARGIGAILAKADRLVTRGDIFIALTGTDRSFDDAMTAIAQFGGSTGRPPA